VATVVATVVRNGTGGKFPNCTIPVDAGLLVMALVIADANVTAAIAFVVVGCFVNDERFQNL